jgi:hypothetical protein
VLAARPRALRDEHSAVIAWTRLPWNTRPRSVTVLREPSRRFRRSAAYVLEEAGPDGGSVVAKLCKRRAAEVETTVYREMLPRIPLPSLRFYGRVDEPDTGGDFCWIFLEHASGRRYSPARREDRTLAGEWLAVMQRSGPELAGAPRLPERGADHYARRLRSTRDRLQARLARAAVESRERLVLETLETRLGELETRWSAVVGACRPFRPTLVHGDFARKNLRVLERGGSPDLLLLFDWEKSGWGVQAPDLAQLSGPERTTLGRQRGSERFDGFAADPCPESYRRALAPGGVPPSPEAVRLFATVGSLFRCVAGVDWSVSSITEAWSPLAHLGVYGHWLARMIGAFDRQSGNVGSG